MRAGAYASLSDGAIEVTASASGALFTVTGGAPRAVGAVLRKDRDDTDGAVVRMPIDADACPRGSCRVVLPLSLAAGTRPALTWFIEDGAGARHDVGARYEPVVQALGREPVAVLDDDLADVARLAPFAEARVKLRFALAPLSFDVLTGPGAGGARADRAFDVPALRSVPAAVAVGLSEVLVTAVARTDDDTLVSVNQRLALPGIMLDLYRPLLIAPRRATRGVASRVAVADVSDDVVIIDRAAAVDVADDAGHRADPLPAEEGLGRHDRIATCEELL